MIRPKEKRENESEAIFPKKRERRSGAVPIDVSHFLRQMPQRHEQN